MSTPSNPQVDRSGGIVYGGGMARTKQARVFESDNKWLNREAKKRHTVVAVVVQELIAKNK